MLNFLDHLEERLTLQYHGKLNQKVFDGDKLKPEIRNKLLEIASAWQKFAKIPDNLVHDVILTGGNCNFNYTIYSDLDVHLVIDRYKLFGPMRMPDWQRKDYIDDYLSDKKTLWSLTRKIRVKGYPVEMYAQDSDDMLAASGVYSLRYNKWLAKPVHRDNYNFKHDEALEKKVDELKDMIDNMISNHSSEADFKVMKDKIKNMRKAALASSNEFSFENLLFKELRNQGVLDRMNQYIEGIKDKELSLE